MVFSSVKRRLVFEAGVYKIAEPRRMYHYFESDMAHGVPVFSSLLPGILITKH